MKVLIKNMHSQEYFLAPCQGTTPNRKEAFVYDASEIDKGLWHALKTDKNRVLSQEAFNAIKLRAEVCLKNAGEDEEILPAKSINKQKEPEMCLPCFDKKKYSGAKALDITKRMIRG